MFFQVISISISPRTRKRRQAPPTDEKAVLNIPIVVEFGNVQIPNSTSESENPLKVKAIEILCSLLTKLITFPSAFVCIKNRNICRQLVSI